MTYSLAEHQVRILSMMEERNTLGIFAEAGTGKTMIALTWIYNRLLDGTIDDALVVCPASLVSSWKLAIERMSEFGYSDFDIDMVRDAISISSYQMIWKSVVKAKRRTYALREWVDREWGAIFVDESHRLGDPSSVQTKSMLKLACHTDYRYILTGTPDSTKYVKLYGQIKFLDPDIWQSYREFDARYVWAKNIFHKPMRYDVESLEQLKRRYGAVARLRECFDMPLATDVDVPVELQSRKVYDDMISYNLNEYGISAQVAGIGTMKALQVCSGFYMDDQGTAHSVECGKMDALLTIVDGSDDKIVVFCTYTESIINICNHLSKKRISHYRFDGTIKEPVWQKFQKDDTKVFVVQYQRGSEGLDLFAACRMVFYEPTTQAVLLEQSKARIMRKGQERPCRYYFFYTPHTIEERIMRRVRTGVDVSRKELDDWAIEERKRLQNGI